MTIDLTHSVIFKRFGTAMIHPLRHNDECARQCTGASLVLVMVCHRSLVQPKAWCHKTQAIALSVYKYRYGFSYQYDWKSPWNLRHFTENELGFKHCGFGDYGKWIYAMATYLTKTACLPFSVCKWCFDFGLRFCYIWSITCCNAYLITENKCILFCM